MKTQTCTGAIEVKKMIQRELNIYFPKTNFRVAYSNEGLRIDLFIRYEDGPRKSEVRRVIQTIENNSYTLKGFKSLSVQLERNMSIQAEKYLIRETKTLLGIKSELSKTDFLPAFNITVGDYIQKIFCVMTFLV